MSNESSIPQAVSVQQFPVLKKRALVIEHRISMTLSGLKVRYWIESDPAYGGVDLLSAEKSIVKAHKNILQRPPADWCTKEKIATILLDDVPSANSVEVCDGHGNGTAVHRDWP